MLKKLIDRVRWAIKWPGIPYVNLDVRLFDPAIFYEQPEEEAEAELDDEEWLRVIWGMAGDEDEDEAEEEEAWVWPPA